MNKIKMILMIFLFNLAGITQAAAWVSEANPLTREVMRLAAVEQAYNITPGGKTALGVPLREALAFRRENLADLYRRLGKNAEELAANQRGLLDFLEAQQGQGGHALIPSENTLALAGIEGGEIVGDGENLAAAVLVPVAAVPVPVVPAIAQQGEGIVLPVVAGEVAPAEAVFAPIVAAAAQGEGVEIEEVPAQQEVQVDANDYPWPGFADHREAPIPVHVNYQNLINRLFVESDAPDMSQWNAFTRIGNFLFVKNDGKKTRKKLWILSGQRRDFSRDFSAHLQELHNIHQNRGIHAAYKYLESIRLRDLGDNGFLGIRSAWGETVYNQVQLTEEAQTVLGRMEREDHDEALAAHEIREDARRTPLNRASIRAALQNLLNYSYALNRQALRVERSRCSLRPKADFIKRRNLRRFINNINEIDSIDLNRKGSQGLKRLLLEYKHIYI